MSNPLHTQSATIPSGLKRVVAAAMAGTVAEWYEFFLYGTASALVFGQLFFRQTDSPIDGIIAAFALYAVGFLARPLGGLVFGHYGDKFGRKRLLQLSLVVVGITTFLMGCLPGFDSIGYAAPVLLVLLRLIQGFAFGGEWGGAILLVSEHCPDNRRGFWASWPQAGVPAGNLVATVALLLLSSNLSEEQFLAWGWRVAFWFSAVVVLIGYWIRTSVDDAPIFKEAQARQAQTKQQQLGVVEVLRHHWRAVLVGIGARFAENILYYTVVTFSITYLKLVVHKDTSEIRRALGALLPDSVDGLFVGYRRAQTDLPDRRGAHCVLGLYRFPDDGHRQQLADHGGDHSGPGHRVDDLCALLGADGRNVPDPCALHRPFTVLPGGADFCRFPGTADRHHPAQQISQLDTHRLVSGGRRVDFHRGRRPDPGNPWQVIAPGGCRIRCAHCCAGQRRAGHGTPG
jgi:MFS family permease